MEHTILRYKFMVLLCWKLENELTLSIISGGVAFLCCVVKSIYLMYLLSN